MEIKKLDINGNAYRSLYEKCGGVFNDPAWLSMYGAALEVKGIYNGDHLVASFHIYRDKKAGFPFYKNPPFTPHIGLMIDSRSRNHSKAITENKKIISLIADFLDSKGKGIVSCAFPHWVKDMQPLIWKKFKAVPNYTYLTDLTLPQEELEERMSAEHRNLYRKSVKDGLVCRPETDMKVVKSLVLKTFDRKSKAIDAKMLDKIMNGYANAENSFSFAAYDGNKPVAAAFCLMDKEHVYYLLSGYDPSAKHGGAGIACVWSSILHAKSIGKKVFDFEGSMLPEVERYFRGFGPEQVPYFTVNKAWLPLEVMLKFIKRENF